MARTTMMEHSKEDKITNLLRMSKRTKFRDKDTVTDKRLLKRESDVSCRRLLHPSLDTTWPRNAQLDESLIVAVVFLNP